MEVFKQVKKYFFDFVGVLVFLPVFLYNLKLLQFELGMSVLTAEEAYAFGLGYLLVGVGLGLPTLLFWQYRFRKTKGISKKISGIVLINAIIPVLIWLMTMSG